MKFAICSRDIQWCSGKFFITNQLGGGQGVCGGARQSLFCTACQFLCCKYAHHDWSPVDLSECEVGKCYVSSPGLDSEPRQALHWKHTTYDCNSNLIREIKQVSRICLCVLCCVDEFSILIVSFNMQQYISIWKCYL